MKIAITGKGGVGKTFIAGTLACRYAASGLTTIAIDADSSPNLGLTLGLSEAEVDRIVPVAENSGLIEEKTQTGYQGVFHLTFTVDDIIRSQAVLTPCGVKILVMGTVHVVGSGCACPAHHLIRTLINHLVTERNEIVILDMEAGIEHLGRGTAEQVDVMLVVTDAHQASLVTAGRIVRMALNAGIPHVALVANRILGSGQEEQIRVFAKGLGVPVAAVIPYDPLVMEAGVQGISPVGGDTTGTRAIAGLITWLSGDA
ncbi:MAG: AAA family ATPase [Methanospirillum sp.]|nr:AAA family ATPase [Methanospirillum sp.]